MADVSDDCKTVSSPLLDILYINDCHGEFENHHEVKFADEMIIVSLLKNEETSHGPWLQITF